MGEVGHRHKQNSKDNLRGKATNKIQSVLFQPNPFRFRRFE